MRYIFLLLVPIIVFISSCKNEGIHGTAEASVKIQGYDFIYKNDPVLKERIDTFFNNRYKSGRFNGVVLFGDNGRIVYENAFGYADFSSKKKLKKNSIFQLASVSKQFTAAAIMLLKQRGVIAYDDSVRKFFPLFPYKNITIHQLLIHNSGLPNYMYFVNDYWKNQKLPITNTDVIELMIQNKPKEYYTPGAKFNYSNTGYCILAAIVEKVSGEPFYKFMKQEFFDPLGMNNTFVYNGDLINESIAKGYVNINREAEYSFQNGVVGDKGVYSTAEDLLIWDQELYNGKILKKEIVHEAFIPEYNFKTNRDYGFGWRIINVNNKKVAYHGGWWKGYRAYFIRSLEEKKTIIVLINVATHLSFRVKDLVELFSEDYYYANNKQIEVNEEL